MDSNSIRELNLEEMNKVSGGVQKTVVTGIATVRSGAGTNYPPCRKLGCNTVVNFTGTVFYNEQEHRRWYKIKIPLSLAGCWAGRSGSTADSRPDRSERQAGKIVSSGRSFARPWRTKRKLVNYGFMPR